MNYIQNYDPFNNPLISTLVALLPIALLLFSISVLKLKAQMAAALGLITALVVALVFYRIPAGMALLSTLYGAAYGLLPIGWIILNILFLFQLVEQKGLFSQLQTSLVGVTPDQRLQLLLVVICLGSFFEGASGFGTPVAITSVILIGLGFPKLQSAVLSLIANSTSVVYGSIGTGMLALQGVTGLSIFDLSRIGALQLIPLNLILAAWLVWTFSGFKRMLEVFPAILTISLSYTITQTAMAVWHGPWLATIAAAVVSLISLLILLHFWKPREIYHPYLQKTQNPVVANTPHKKMTGPWLPWIILCGMVFLWGIPQVKLLLDSVSLSVAIPGLDGAVIRTPPLSFGAQPLGAVYTFNWLSSIGSAVLLGSLLTGKLIGHSWKSMLQAYWLTLLQAAGTLLTISLLIALGFITRYAGLDATLGLAFASSGVLYPFFGTVLGWLGVITTGSITASNVLFGNLQQISASQLGINPVTMAAANTSGGVAGKLISPQSIAITATATSQVGSEHKILRRILPHSLAMICLMGLVVVIQVYLLR
jgi:lactate permease